MGNITPLLSKPILGPTTMKSIQGNDPLEKTQADRMETAMKDDVRLGLAKNQQWIQNTGTSKILTSNYQNVDFQKIEQFPVEKAAPQFVPPAKPGCIVPEPCPDWMPEWADDIGWPGTFVYKDTMAVIDPWHPRYRDIRHSVWPDLLHKTCRIIFDLTFAYFADQDETVAIVGAEPLGTYDDSAALDIYIWYEDGSYVGPRLLPSANLKQCTWEFKVVDCDNEVYIENVAPHLFETYYDPYFVFIQRDLRNWEYGMAMHQLYCNDIPIASDWIW